MAINVRGKAVPRRKKGGKEGRKGGIILVGHEKFVGEEIIQYWESLLHGTYDSGIPGTDVYCLLLCNSASCNCAHCVVLCMSVLARMS